ncbi:hypothetical protein [Actinomadura napierensis]|uniref:hypothetical protein n=1 Tax=Actinomadura napierensis TaxID=267854 RepID=UPI0031D1ACED
MMTTLMMMPVSVTGSAVSAASTPTTGAASGAGTGGCSNCGSVRSVRVLPGGRRRCACGHRWTPPPLPPAVPVIGDTAGGWE